MAQGIYSTEVQVKAMAMILGSAVKTLETLSPGWRTTCESELVSASHLFLAMGKPDHANSGLEAVECARDMLEAAFHA